MTALPKPDRFVSGTLATGRLVLTRASGSRARCGVVIVHSAAFTDNGDSTLTLTLPA